MNESYLIYYDPQTDKLFELDVKHGILYFEDETIKCILGKVLDSNDLDGLEIV